MRVHEMRELAPENMNGQILDARKEIVQLRFELAARKLENTGKLREARKRLARLLTIQTEKINPNHKPLAKTTGTTKTKTKTKAKAKSE